MVTSNTFNSQITWRKYHIRSNISCKTKKSGLSYISCKKCSLQYVGETENALHVRMNRQCSDVRTKKTEKPVAAHFCQPDHTIHTCKWGKSRRSTGREREWACEFSPSECCLTAFSIIAYSNTAYSQTFDSSLPFLYLNNNCEHFALSVLYRVSRIVCKISVL